MPTKTPRPYRILLYNLGYATGLDGSTMDYILRWYRYLFTPQIIIEKIRRSIYELLHREQPDICCFVEIHKHHGFVPHPRAFFSHIDNKYGLRSILRWIPFFRDNCNGFFSHRPLHFRKRYFENGTKKLIYEIDLGNNMTLFLAHFALSAAVRKKQTEELKRLLAHRTNIILCGDFNVFNGTRELASLAEACDLHIVDPSPSFPTIRPRKALDLFLCSNNLQNVSAHVLRDVHMSDHLPVMLEVERA